MKNGRRQWVADYTGSEGKRVQKFFPTKEEAQDHFADGVRLSRQRTTPDLPPTMTVAEYAMHWFTLLGHLEQETRDRYEQNWRVHLKPAFGPRRVRDLTRGSIVAFLAKKREALGRATVTSMHNTFSALLSAAVDDELLIGNPAAKLGKKLRLLEPSASRRARIEAKAMTLAQRDLFLATAYEVEPWWAPMWDVEVRIGVRPGEMYALEEEDFDLNGAVVQVQRQLHDSGRYVKPTLKGKRARTVDLSPKVVSLVRRQIERRKVEKLRRGWREMPKPLFCASDVDVRVHEHSALAQGYANPKRVR